jgi:hypothetical protein
MYFSNGNTVQSKPWGLAKLTDIFWNIVNFFVLFFKTLFDPTLTKKGSSHSTDYRSSGRPADTGRKMGRVRPGGSSNLGPGAPPMGGG